MTTKLDYDSIVDGSRPWFDVLDCDMKDADPCHIRRIQRFLKNANIDPIKAKSIDLATLLIILRHRNCYIQLPSYKTDKVQKEHENQIDVGGLRRGKIIELKSNQYTFNFSITIENEKYVELKGTKEYEFCPRTYTLTDENGNLVDNWKEFNFTMDDKEKEFLSNIIDASEINCDRFVNNQLAQAFYTDYYRLMKITILRLVAERKYLSDLKKKYVKLLPPSDVVSEGSSYTTSTDKDKYESVKQLCFEAKISNFDEDTLKFSYINEKLSPKEIVDVCEESMRGLITLTSEYKFMCRLIELAFTKMNPYSENMDPKNFQTYNRCDCKWNEQKVKLPRSRTEWFELMFKSYSILCRYYTKSIQKKIKE